MERQRLFFLKLAAIFGGLAVVFGAFGAHGLEQRLSADMLETFEIAVRYHFYHALAMLAVAAAPSLWRTPWPARACWAWTIGVAVFSGTLYVLALTEQTWLGAITPIGGVAMIAGWFLLIPAARAERN